MKNLVTFSKQANGYIDFQVKAGYYAASVLENEAIYYTPNPVIGEEAPIRLWVEPDGMESKTDFDDTYDAECRVYVYSKRTVNANCPKGWSAVVIDLKQYGENLYVEVKKILFTRPFQMKEVAAFFRKELSIEEAKVSYRKEMEVINIHPMRVFDVLEAYETVPAERVIKQNLSIEEALYVSREHYGMVHSQQPFSFFGENQFPVFYRGELLCTGERCTNDTFQIALPSDGCNF